MVNVIGFVGFIGSGKGAAGDILSEFGYEKESFAKSVKDSVAAMFGWDRKLLEGDTECSRLFRESPCLYWSEKFGKPFTPREALQKLGTEVGRDIFNPNLWVSSLESRLDSDKNYVITDVRFPNEIEWIRNMGGEVYEIQRGAYPPWFKSLKCTNPYDSQIRNNIMNGWNIHYSEWAWVGCSLNGTIKNEGSIQDLTNLLKFVTI